MTMREDGRAPDALRPVTIETDVQPYAEGSALISCGNTRVLCAATVEDKVPDWMQGRGRGWVTGEYGMLPRSTHTRISRSRAGGSSRTQEIRRLIGRALRASADLDALGERMVTIDCDVIQADGGTRTASVTGGYVALALALRPLIENGAIPATAMLAPLSAVSVGIIDGVPMLDLCYSEDSAAEVDMNVVMDCRGRYVEVQGTAEGEPFDRAQLDALLDLAADGCRELLAAQRVALGVA